MIVDTKEKFESSIATAMDATSEIYDSMTAYLRNAEQWVKSSILGTFLYDKVDSLEEDIITQLGLVVSLRAFIEAIPFIDLVLTPTGFGVVSNTNLAPASKDRVERLQQQSQNVLDDAVDSLIFSLNASKSRSEWVKGEAFPGLTDSLIWRAEELRLYAGRPFAHRSTLLELRPQISACEFFISTYISKEYLSELIGKLRENKLSAEDRSIFVHLWRVMGLYLQGLKKSATQQLYDFVNVMEKNPESFQTYIGSQAYKLKHTPVYENKKEDSSYFWG